MSATTLVLGASGSFGGGVALDDARPRALLPDFGDTPLDEAIRLTLESYRAASASAP